MPILLKLYRCFCHDLKICMWFGYYPEIIFCHFFCNLNLVIFKCTIMAGDINSLNLLVMFDSYDMLANFCNIKSISPCCKLSHYCFYYMLKMMPIYSSGVFLMNVFLNYCCQKEMTNCYNSYLVLVQALLCFFIPFNVIVRYTTAVCLYPPFIHAKW